MNRAALLLLLAAPACVAIPAPTGRVAAEGEWTSGGGKQSELGPDLSVDIRGGRLYYQFNPFGESLGENASLIVGYWYREYIQDNFPGRPALRTHQFFAGPRWHWQALDEIRWFAGINAGVLPVIDSTDYPLTNYSWGVMVEPEVGLYWDGDETWGVQLLGTYSISKVFGTNAFTSDPRLSGFSLMVGAYLDF